MNKQHTGIAVVRFNMNNIYIVNKHHKPTVKTIYCGRGSPLGNPFQMKAKEERDKVCDEYKEYFNHQITIGNDAMLSQLRLIWREWQHKDVYLECYCYPLRCHCETIRDFLLKHP